MARKKKGNGQAKPRSWQNASLNQRNYIMYRDWIMALAMMRYRWVGLPESCDSRYLEWTLLTQGVATIAKGETDDGIEIWASTQAATLSTPNVYDNYPSWESFGNNGWRFPVTPANGVLVWDNRLRFPVWNQIDLYARKLAKCSRVIDGNLQQQMVTKLVTVPQTRVNDMLQVIKQNSGGEPYVLGIDGMTKDMETQVLGMETEFIANDVQIVMENIWNEVYTLLGIENITKKAERMIEDEVNSSLAPTKLRALDGLETRRDACRKLRERFGIDVDVFWFEDYHTENFNTFESIKKLEEVVDYAK